MPDCAPPGHPRPGPPSGLSSAAGVSDIHRRRRFDADSVFAGSLGLTAVQARGTAAYVAQPNSRGWLRGQITAIVMTGDRGTYRL